MVLITAKLNINNIYDGCLTYLRNSLTSEIAEGRKWSESGIKSLVGTKTPINEHVEPFDSPPAFFKIYFGQYYIKPISYSLMGRRISQFNDNYLQGWDFYGRNKNNEWVLLSSYSNSMFNFAEERHFPLEDSDFYSGFMLKMTQPDSSGKWALCIGQIEVHGYIYNSIPFNSQSSYIWIHSIRISNIFHFLFTLAESN